MMPHSPISRTDSGSVSAIKHFLFGGALDATRNNQHNPHEVTPEPRPPVTASIFRGHILRATIFKPQIIKSQLIKARIQRSSDCHSGSCENDANFPNNLRALNSHTHNNGGKSLHKLNNLSSSSFRNPVPKLSVENRECVRYTSSPNLSLDPTVTVTSESESVYYSSGTLPRNFHGRGARPPDKANLKSVDTLPPLPLSSIPTRSSCAPGSNLSFELPYQESGASDRFQQPEKTITLTPPDQEPQIQVTLHQDNPTYGCVPSDTPSNTPTNIPSNTPCKEAPRKGGRQVSSVILKIENGLFATATKDNNKQSREGRGRDRRPLDPSSTLPLPPPPPCIIVKKEVEKEVEGEEWTKATVTGSGPFLARCVKIEDLSNRDGGDDGREAGAVRQPPERRESGRFQSAARLLRSLARSRDEDHSGARARDASEPRLTRSNPNYHSEGKGLKKKNNWTSERELNNSMSPTQKERSHSFCDKAATKRRYSYHDNKTLKEESRGRLERQDLTTQADISTPSPSREPLPPTPPSPSLTPTPTPSITGSPVTSSPEKISENIYENLPAHKNSSDGAVNGEGSGVGDAAEGGVTASVARTLERTERERRSVRKLTKDSGYETSPYSESDYANIDLCADALASTDGDGDGDDVTLAPESELAASPSPGPQSSPAITDTSTIRGLSTLERRCSWQPPSNTVFSSSQDCPDGAGTPPSSPGLPTSPLGVPEVTSDGYNDHRSSGHSPLPKNSSAESLSSFAESLVSPEGGSGSSTLVSAKSTPSLHQNVSFSRGSSARHSAVTSALHASRSTPNLDDAEDNSMVTKSSMYSYLHGAESSSSTKKGGSSGSGVVGARYWDSTMGADSTPDREDYAHHLRSSSYQLLHSRQLSALSSGSAGSFHSRQHSNASNYSEPDDLSPRGDHSHHGHHHGMDRARFFSFDNLGPEPAGHKYHGSWNISEPDLTFAPPPYSPPGPGYQQPQAPVSPTTATSTAPSLTSVQHSPTFSSPTNRHPSSPPPPPVRDASSLKYIKYGPGHEKYPSWPVPAASQVMAHESSSHEANVAGLAESSSQSSTPQGSHRSKSWTEQSEYPKEKAGGYARPYNKKPVNQSFQRQLKTVMERTEKIPKEVFHSSLREDIFTGSNYSFSDYYKPDNSYYPLYDRDGRALDDKDYSIPSPPERDITVGEASLGQVTAAQLEEYVRQYEEFGYTDLIGTTPLLDQLRRESVMWDGSSERDSGRGESESVADSSRYSNGRESVTTVVTNSSSASSSETLKWHGSLSDISVMSGQSRDPRSDHNIVHSSRVQAPQRHNSESVLYYGADGRGKAPHGKLGHESRDHRDMRRSVRDTESGYPRLREGKWNREVERNNEMNNLKKFPSYSYTQPLSQITEAPTAELRETPKSSSRSPQSPTIDFSKPPSVAERIHELERQSRSTGKESVARWPRDSSGSRDRDLREPLDRRESQEFRRSHEESLVHELRDQNEKLEGRIASEHWDIGETRTHQRRGSRDRELRLDFSRTERKPETGVDNLRSPTSSGSASWSPVQRDADGRPFVHENFQNIMNTFTEVDRVDRHDRNSNVSYSYLDPEKRRKVSDATLKSIQKQAVMSFYERHASKNMGGASISDLSSASSQSSLVSSQSAPETSQGKWANTTHTSSNQNLRTDKSGRAGKGLARLGRVPESECDEPPHRPGRRRSTSGRDSGSEATPEDNSHTGSRRSSLASDVASSRGEEPPALPQKPVQHVLQEGCGGSSPPLSQAAAVGSDEVVSPSPAHPNAIHDSSSRSSRPEPDGGSPPGVLSSPQTEQPRPPSLPPPLHNDPPPRPPERPPKKPTLRSLFHGPGSDTSQQAGATTTDQLEKPSLEPDTLRVEDPAAHDSRNASPGRTYFYRKPPAPDPPKSPEATPTATCSSSPASVGSPSSVVSSPPRPLASPSSHLLPPTTTTSRSSTPDLPPPPPPPMTEEEVLVSDEPLPPPPTPSEVAAPPHTDDTKSPNTPQTYHKDSYMAHRRDWKTGFEGRYRRTISPSSSSRNLLCPRELSSATTSPPPSTTTTGPERRSSTTAVPTTTGTATTPTSPSGSRRTFSASQLIHSNSHYPCDDKTPKTNGWQGSGQSGVSSTTVSFTAEELKAFKARRAYAQDSVSQPHPSQLLQSSQSSPALSAMPPLSLTPSSLPLSFISGDADSSLASEQFGSSISPSRPSPTQSWRASLDSLNQSCSPSGAPIATNNKQSPRTITRATSLAETFQSSEECRKSQEGPQLPRASSINESLSRITAISDSLSRSTSVADSLCRSMSVTETPVYNRSNSVSDASSHLSSLPEAPAVSPASPMSSVPHDGPVTAHPATVTEEAASPVSSKSSPVHHPSSPETLPSPVAHSPAAVSMPSLTTSTSSPAAASDISNSPAHPVTSPSMSSSMEPVHHNIIVLGYGRTPYQEELDCDRLSQDYVPHFSMDNKLRALLAPGPEHKTTAHFMQGVFNLELRRDLITSVHASHPDVSQPPRSLPLQTNTDHTNGAQMVSERAPLPSDSAYFTSESKAKMLTRLRGSSDALHHNITQHSQLNKKKEELVASIGRKLDILRAEREAIKEEMRLNKELGAEVTSRVEARARLAEADKYKLHVEEIDKITSLLLGLSGRLARAENALFMMVEDADPEEKNILERKRDKLSEQLEEAKRLKENIDRRAIQVSKVLNQYLTEDQYADYDHFIKMKAKLIMDAREIDDKIKLGEEQQQALRETMSKKQ